MAIISSSASSLVFKVERKKPEMIRPAELTPYEFKLLSDLDDQKGLRKQNRLIQVYRYTADMEGRDPVKIIREAIAKVLVFYYPFAGRIREGANEKLMVECTGEGVIFIEADAEVRLEQFGEHLYPPFPCVDELLYSVPGTSDILHCPLLLFQVTRLLCGGFVVATRLNHSMTDATGYAQFMKALGEMARGASVPSVRPVWKRELLNARNPPRVTCIHRAFEPLQPGEAHANHLPQKMAQRSFFFGAKEIARLRNQVQPHLQNCSTFDLLAGCVWRCRTIALNINPNDEVRLAIIVNARPKFNPPLPVGFYGYACARMIAESTASKLCQSPLGCVVELIRRAKDDLTEEYMKSLADLLVTNSRCRAQAVRTLVISDLRRIPLTDIDFGWGKAVYGGPIWGGDPSCFFIALKSDDVEDGIVVTMDLPEPAMIKFTSEINKTMSATGETKPHFIRSNV